MDKDLEAIEKTRLENGYYLKNTPSIEDMSGYYGIDCLAIYSKTGARLIGCRGDAEEESRAWQKLKASSSPIEKTETIAMPVPRQSVDAPPVAARRLVSNLDEIMSEARRLDKVFGVPINKARAMKHGEPMMEPAGLAYAGAPTPK